MVCRENVHLAAQFGRFGWEREDCGSLPLLPHRGPQGLTPNPPSHCPGPAPEGTARAKPPSSQLHARRKRDTRVLASCAPRVFLVFASYSLIETSLSPQGFCYLWPSCRPTQRKPTRHPGLRSPTSPGSVALTKHLQLFAHTPGSAYANWSGMKPLPAVRFCGNNTKE